MDYAALFAAIPTPYLVLTPDLVIVEANAAYLGVVGRTREELVGRPLFEAFPPTADDLDGSGASRVQISFERARDSGRPDTMPILRYDIQGPDGLEERFWSLISVPVPDATGRTALLLQRAEDITDYVREQARGKSERERGKLWRRRVQEAESDLYARGLELRDAVEARDVAARRLTILAEVALLLTSAQSLEDLTSIIVDRGLAALGADGGAVAVRDDEMLHLTVTASLGGRTQDEFGVLPLDGPLPASVAARTAKRILLPDRDAMLAFSPELQSVLDTTDCEAWATLPLQSADRVLGALSVGWRQPRAFTDGEVEVLEALAAQCAHGLERIQSRQVERRSAYVARRMSETLQRSLLTEPPQPDHLDVAVRYRPAAQEAQVGGDWYDAFLTADGASCLVIGDVAGHDRDAAAAMGQLRNLLRGIAYTVGEPPALVLSALDRAVRDLAVGSLATAVLARIEQDPDDVEQDLRRLRWSNAGHPPPLVLEPDGRVHLLQTDADLLLGLDPDTDRHDHVHVLRPGAVVLLYTDGLVERRGAGIDHGLARLVAAAVGLADRSLDEVCDTLLERLSDASGDDDIAMLAVRVHPRDADRPAESEPATVDLSLERSFLAPDVTSVRAARAFVRRQCHLLGLPVDACDDVVVLSSEIVTNAITHGRSEARVTITSADGRLRLEVSDDNSRHPEPAAEDVDALDGRGLNLIEQLASRWGVQDDPYGKTVWFELDLPDAEQLE